MSANTEQPQLAVIMFTDMVGYNTLGSASRAQFHEEAFAARASILYKQSGQTHTALA